MSKWIALIEMELEDLYRFIEQNRAELGIRLDQMEEAFEELVEELVQPLTEELAKRGYIVVSGLVSPHTTELDDIIEQLGMNDIDADAFEDALSALDLPDLACLAMKYKAKFVIINLRCPDCLRRIILALYRRGRDSSGALPPLHR